MKVLRNVSNVVCPNSRNESFIAYVKVNTDELLTRLRRKFQKLHLIAVRGL